MTRQDRMFKWLLYALGVLPIWIGETMFLNRVPLLGVIPVLLPLAPVAVGLWEGPLPGAGYGLAVGILADAVYPGTPGGMTLALAAVGWLTGWVSQWGMKQNYLGYLLCATLSMGILELFRVIGALVTRLADPLSILRVAGLEAGWSLCFTLPIFGLYKLLYRRVGGDRLGGPHDG